MAIIFEKYPKRKLTKKRSQILIFQVKIQAKEANQTNSIANYVQPNLTKP